MTEHLPECPSFDACVLPDCIHGKSRCICDALRSCEERALDDAVQRVEAMPHALECVTRDANYSRPCNCLRGDALDAIKGDQP